MALRKLDAGGREPLYEVDGSTTPSEWLAASDEAEARGVRPNDAKLRIKIAANMPGLVQVNVAGTNVAGQLHLGRADVELPCSVIRAALGQPRT